MNLYQSKNFPNKTLPIKHSTEDLIVLEKIIKKYDPELVIELGTFKGGFTLFLSEILPKSVIMSFDINPILSDEYKCIIDLISPNCLIQFYTGDILRNKKIIEFIREIIKSVNSNIIIYCDNGNKNKEVRIYNKFLLKGHVIAVHDWGTEANPLVIEECLQEKFKRTFLTKEEISTAFFKKVVD